VFRRGEITPLFSAEESSIHVLAEIALCVDARTFRGQFFIHELEGNPISVAPEDFRVDVILAPVPESDAAGGEILLAPLHDFGLEITGKAGKKRHEIPLRFSSPPPGLKAAARREL
jgi:hypothetical protein